MYPTLGSLKTKDFKTDSTSLSEDLTVVIADVGSESLRFKGTGGTERKFTGFGDTVDTTREFKEKRGGSRRMGKRKRERGRGRNEETGERGRNVVREGKGASGKDTFFK